IVDIDVRASETFVLRPILASLVYFLIIVVCIGWGKKWFAENGGKDIEGTRGSVGNGSSGSSGSKEGDGGGSSLALRQNWFNKIEGFCLRYWSVLAVSLFLGLFIIVLTNDYAIGGHIVVVSRSLLDFFLWVLLCNLAFYKKVSPVSLFIVLSFLVKTISWIFSYVTTPRLFSLELTAALTAANMIVPAVAFVLIAATTLILAAITRKRFTGQTLLDEALGSPHFVVPLIVPLNKAKAFKLTRRETEVIELFAQGYTLKKAAADLYISTSTAQSHIKNAYRKLNVHSKDELIAMIEEWNHEDNE
ncbi:MAG: helix-turn-helix transcriptional regulator, partial [Eggerthellaceae bacterium]|nr:helix-turn-helix transcriptional regulator [Eggerthellaceae bacterium]